ncbi:hypothetical protein, partial [Pseudomonas aeruginosa]
RQWARRSGGRVRFVAIGREAFLDLGGRE